MAGRKMRAPEGYQTISEFAETNGYSYNFVRSRIQTGELKTVRICNHSFVRKGQKLTRKVASSDRYIPVVRKTYDEVFSIPPMPELLKPSRELTPAEAARFVELFLSPRKL